MDLIKSAAKVRAEALKLTARAGDALKVASDALNGVKEAAHTHQPEIAAKTHEGIQALGKTLENAGSWAASHADPAFNQLRYNPSTNESRTRRVLHRFEKYAVGAYGAAGRFTTKVGASAVKASPVIGAATGGALSGAAGTISGAFDSFAITDRHFDQLYCRIRTASPSVKADLDSRAALIAQAQRKHRKRDLLDLLVVGGVSLSFVLLNPSQTPADVEDAFERAYPGLAGGGESFADVIGRLPTEDLVGLVSGVKGKLFEIQLVEHLNDGNLPEGVRAELAGSVTQPGYDIQILDEQGQLVEVLQAKATDSVAYVREALERYPGIDVTTTTEVHAELMALGIVEGLRNSGISEQALELKIEAALESGDSLDAADVIPSSLGLAVIALSSFIGGSSSLEQRGAEFGDRAAKATVAGTAAAFALVATNTWWLALAAGMGSRSLTTYGGNKRQRYEMLKQVVQTLEAR